jgi:hypothetical protein
VAWHIPVIPALRRLKQEDEEFEAIYMGYILIACLRKKKAFKLPQEILRRVWERSKNKKSYLQ